MMMCGMFKKGFHARRISKYMFLVWDRNICIVIFGKIAYAFYEMSCIWSACIT